MVSMTEFLQKNGYLSQRYDFYKTQYNDFCRAFPCKSAYTLADLDNFSREKPYFAKSRLMVEKYLRLNSRLVEKTKEARELPKADKIAVKHALHGYLKHLRRKNMAAGTIELYGYYYKVFCRFAETRNIDYIEDIDNAVINSFKDHLYRTKHCRGKHYTVSHQKKILMFLGQFFGFLVTEKIIKANPCVHLTFPRVEKRVSRNYLTRNETDDFLNAIDTSSLVGFMERTIYELLYSTGIRRGELWNLEINDLNFEDRLLTIREGKGKKDRVCPLTIISKKYLEIYVNEVRPLYLYHGVETDYLFPSVSGKKQKKTYLDSSIKRYKELAGIERPFSPLAFRHSFATHLLNEGVNIRHIQKLMGHETIDATLCYINIAVEDLQAALSKHHPREKFLAEKEILFEGTD